MEKVILELEGKELYEIPVVVAEGEFSSITKMIPVDGYVLVVAHLKATTFDVISNKAESAPASVKYYLGSSCPVVKNSLLKFNIGDRLKLPDHIDPTDGTLIPIFDSDNKFSPSIIKEAAKKDPMLVAANAIARAKAKTGFGLNVDEGAYSISQQLKNVSIAERNTLFKDTDVDLVIYYITHFSSILGKIYS